MQTAEFDAANRPVKQTTGVQSDNLAGNNGESWVGTEYTAQGTVKRVTSSYGTNDGVLVSSVKRDADGVVKQIVYGDAASTSTDFTHDTRRRVRTVQTHRNAPSIWSSPPSGYSPTYSTEPTTSFQLVLQDDELTYDAVDNPVHIRDWRNPAEWPVGSKPASRTMQYDDLNRVTRIDYLYHDSSNSQGYDDWISPFENENTGANIDSRRAQPSPHVSFGTRVKVQSFGYDWLGNQNNTDDDSHGFFDRSMGTVVNNSANDKPYQLASAEQTNGDRTGALETRYDVTGNLVDMALSRDGNCLPTGASCSQRFAYDWDEVGRMVRARRWDTPNPSVLDPWPTAVPEADLLYHYDSSDSRVIKTAVDQEEEQSHTVYIFSSLELRRATFDTTGTPNDYEDSHDTEVGYLFGHGRLHWDDSGAPEIGGAKLHVLFELGDHLGSSSKVLDKATSELVEASTYMGYGQAESDYRPGRWKGYRADYRFTGKEEDSEVGLTYFGKRFLVPGLGRWASADPLAVHAMGADPNLYAYVGGALLRAVDPAGLDKFDMRQERWNAMYENGQAARVKDEQVAQGVGALAGISIVGCAFAGSLCAQVGFGAAMTQANNHDEALEVAGKFLAMEGAGQLAGAALSRVSNAIVGAADGDAVVLASTESNAVQRTVNSIAVDELPTAGAGEVVDGVALGRIPIKSRGNSSASASGTQFSMKIGGEGSEAPIAPDIEKLLKPATSPKAPPPQPDPTYEIVDGLKRGKATELAYNPTIEHLQKHSTIDAFIGDSGKPTSVPINSLLARKATIDTSPSGALERWTKILTKAIGGGRAEPIKVVPGKNGVRLRDVVVK